MDISMFISVQQMSFRFIFHFLFDIQYSIISIFFSLKERRFTGEHTEKQVSLVPLAMSLGSYLSVKTTSSLSEVFTTVKIAL